MTRDARVGDGVTALLFMHVPKTAGTSLREALGSVFPPPERQYIYDETDLPGALAYPLFINEPEPVRTRVRFAMGHFPYGLHEYLPQRSRYVTMLRHPVDRVVSLYYHFKLTSPHLADAKPAAEQDAIRRGELRLADWVATSKRLELDNGMVRQVAGHPKVRFGACSDDLLKVALDHIDERFAAVLVRGLMPQSVEVLEGMTGLRLPRIPRANVSHGRPPISAIDGATRQRILELNHLDARLFQLTVERFPAVYARWVS